MVRGTTRSVECGVHLLRTDPRGRPAGSTNPTDPRGLRSARRRESSADEAVEGRMTSDPEVVRTLRSQRIELPSWAFGNSGTRFKVFAQQGVPRDPFEKVADAAQVHRFTGVAPTVALHIPWDRVDDYGELADHAAACGVALGTINSNT